MSSTPTTRVTAREWIAEEGSGVIDSPETPGGCWAHFSDLDMAGYKPLVAGQQELFTVEPPDQDSHCFRALHVWVQGPEPQPWPTPSEGLGGAFRSGLTVRLDQE